MAKNNKSKKQSLDSVYSPKKGMPAQQLNRNIRKNNMNYTNIKK